MKHYPLLTLVLAAAVLISCDAPSGVFAPEAPTPEADVMTRTRITAEAAEARAEARQLAALARPRPAASKRAAGARTPHGVIDVPGDFATIQEAVDAAAPGDVVRVRGGFKDQGVIDVFTDGLTLDGTRAHLEGRDDLAARFQIFADDVRITGFTLKRMRIWIIGGDRVEVSGNHVSHTGSALAVFGGSRAARVVHNQAHNSVHGLFLTDTEANHVEGNVFQHNRSVGIILTGEGPANDNVLIGNVVNGNLRGVRIFGSHGNRLSACTANGSDVAGILLFEATNNVVTDCTANGNGFGGIVLIDSDGNTISQSHANGNKDVGVKLIEADGNTVEDSRAHGNEVCDAVDGGAGNVFTGNSFGTFNCL